MLIRQRRFVIFAIIGGAVLVFGLLVQALLVRAGMRPTPAYIAQGIASVQLSFGLNRYITWQDRSPNLWAALWKFNAQKLVGSIVNTIAFALLFRAGLPWLAANLAVTAFFTPVNYLLGHHWVFTGQPPPDTQPLQLWPHPLPTVSVVIPCKNNPTTIGATVNALLAQDYPALAEVILVGDENDPTWKALLGIRDDRLIILEQEPTPGRRDPAIKRDKGAQKASGEILAFCDSDIVMPNDWLSRGVMLLHAQGGGVVAGGMRSIRDAFWGRFVDSTSLGAKTPRLPAPYEVTAANFGKRGSKPPVLANAILPASVYQDCPLDTNWAFGYEDYEWAWRIVAAGHRILLTSALDGLHHHRSSFRALAREYSRAADGCARFVRAHPHAPLARKRRRQAILLPPLALAALVLSVGAITMVPLTQSLELLGFGYACLAAWEVSRAQRVEAVTYPLISLTLAGIFAQRLSRTMASTVPSPTRHVAKHAATATAPLPLRRRPREPVSRRMLAAMSAVITGGLLLRLWQLKTAPDWQVDEITYSTIAKNYLHLQRLALPPSFKEPWKPFLFHPPFYSMLLSRWFALFGASIYSARIMGVLCATIMFGLLAWFLWREYGAKPAVITMLLLVTDGWLLYVQRVSYMENVLMILVVGTVLALQQALRTEQWRWFAIAGALAGISSIFKHTGFYIVLTIVCAFLLTRRNVLKHLLAIGVSGIIIVVYVWFMIHTDGLQASFTRPFVLAWGHHNYYVQQTLVQLRRTLGAQKNGGGGLTSPVQFFHLLFSRQYAIFIPSFLAVCAGLFFLGRDYWWCWRTRSFAPLGGHIVLTAWTTTGVVVFSIIALKFSQYFILFLLPLYCYLWTSVAKRAGHWRVSSRALVAGIAAVALLGYGSFQLRIHSSPGNVLKEAITYVRTHVPKNDLVIASTPIAYALPPQPWCTQRDPALKTVCIRDAKYLVTWTTYLQPVNPESNPQFAQLLTQSTPIHVIQGFNGTVTIWRVNR